MKHDRIEKNVGLMGVLIIAVISIAGLVEIIPLAKQAQIIQPADGVGPHTALELAGRGVYVREGCYLCHSQQIRPFRSETERYGPFSVAGESVYERPFLWGSKRTGPDLARVGGRYSDDWHRVHLMAPRDLVPQSNMPGFPWLQTALVDAAVVQSRMSALQMLGHPYSDEDIDSAAAAVDGRTEMDAMIAYLQALGTNASRFTQPNATASASAPAGE